MPKPRHLRRGIYLLPTLFTVGNLFCGYSSIMLSSIGRIETAALMILFAAVLDGLDGRIARMTGSTSEFGLQFDSLADIVSFGVAPAFLVFHWGLGPGRIGWALAFLYVVCVAMRLARYNIQKPATDKRFFVGLPAPMAGCALASLVFVFPELPRSRLIPIALAVLVFGVAILMVSRARYRSFRDIDLRNRRSYIYVLPIAAIIAAVVMRPEIVLPLLFIAYLVLAPILYLVQRRSLRFSVADLAGETAARTSEVADESALR